MLGNISKVLIGVGLCSATLGGSAMVAALPGASPRIALSAPSLSTVHPSAGRSALAVTATTGDVPPENPSKSLGPSPNFTDDGSCGPNTLDDSDRCMRDAVQSIDNGRSVLEAMAPLSFNLTSFESMTVPEQLFVIANEERIDRGLSPLSGLTTQLDNASQTGASNNADPTLSSSTLTGGANIQGWGSNWAGGTSNALGSDYYWMYDDGTNSFNTECSTPSSKACWGHRDNVLGTFAGSSCEQYMGAGDTPTGWSSGPSFAEIIVGACGPTPTDVVFTWAQAQQLLGGGGGTTVPGVSQTVTAVSATKRGVVLSWQAPADNGGSTITGYRVFRARSAGAETFHETVTCSSSACTFADRHAKGKVMMFYKLAAVNAVGPGPLSPEVSARAR